MLSRVRALATSGLGLLAAASRVDAAPELARCLPRRRGARTRRPGCGIAANAAHRLPVRADRREHDRRGAPCVENPLSRPAIAKLAASRLTSHSHGPGQRLVEVVDVEHQPPLRRGEHAEVRQVRVAAQLHARAPTSACAARSAAMISARAPVERERRRPASGRSGSAPAPAPASPPAPPAARPDRARSGTRTRRGSTAAPPPAPPSPAPPAPPA